MSQKNILLCLTSIIVLTSTLSVCFANAKSHATGASTEHPVMMTSDRSFKGWEIGGALLYLYPYTSSDLMQFGVTDSAENSDQELNLVTGSDQGLGNYHTGFDAFARYYFGNGQDLTLRYTYFDGHSEDEAECGGDYCRTYPSDEVYMGYADIAMHTNFNSADLLFGQRLRVGELFKLRLFAGLTAARIKVDIEQYYDTYHDHEESYLDFSYDSKFEGIGPKVGLDGEYQLGIIPISLYMAASGAGLVGESKALTTEDQYIPNNPNFNPPLTEYVLDSEDHHVLVPNINFDLGLRYQYAFNAEFASAILLGYRVNQYFNSVRNVIEYRGEEGGTQVDDTSDFSLNGPYLELSAFF